MSTMLLMGRMPISLSRRCIQAGEGPILRSVAARPVYRGHRSPFSTVTFTRSFTSPSPSMWGMMGAFIFWPRAAAASRTRPMMLLQSGRLGSTEKSKITSSRSMAFSMGMPRGVFSLRIRMPSTSAPGYSTSERLNSWPEQNMPWLSTPRMLATVKSWLPILAPA